MYCSISTLKVTNNFSLYILRSSVGLTNTTHGKVMMEGLQLWKKFEELKRRACDEEGSFVIKTLIGILISFRIWSSKYFYFKSAREI